MITDDFICPMLIEFKCKISIWNIIYKMIKNQRDQRDQRDLFLLADLR